MVGVDFVPGQDIERTVVWPVLEYAATRVMSVEKEDTRVETLNFFFYRVIS